MNNIITTWLEYLEYQNKTLDQGLYELNAHTRLSIRPHHITEMKKGKRGVPKKAYAYMVDEVFEFALIQCKLKMIHYDNVRTFHQIMGEPGK